MIASVWAAYSADKTAEGQISFVVVVKEDIKLDKMKDYRFVIRKQGQVNNEGKDVLNSKKFDKYLSEMSIKDVQSIRESINKNNIKLMKKHKYLTVISASPVRSKGYGGNHIIECEACIVFYVLVKGYIPINEEPFALKYNGVAVDVREGFFVNYGANDFQATLKHGCQIERQMQGTLGGFITHREFGTCGLTSGHVLLTPDEFKKFNPGNTMQDWNIRHSDNMVYQPSQAGSGINDHFCGMLVRAVYLEGGGGESGIDVAIFQVEKRFPDGGDFPVLKRGRSSGMRYDSGKTAGATRLGFGGVTKYGAGTGERKGTVLFNAPVMSVKHYPENIFKVDGKYVLRLHNLLEVKTCNVSSKNEPLPFAGPRDSGALVFCEGEAKDLYCVGMIEGGITAGTCAVMPIAPILQHLQIPAMKSFERNKLEQKVDKGFEDMRSSFNKVMGAIRQKNRTTSSKRKKYANKK